MKPFCILFSCLHLYLFLSAQNKRIISGKVFDAYSKEPLKSAIITDSHKNICLSDISGSFRMVTEADFITVAFSGYDEIKIATNQSDYVSAALTQSGKLLQQIVVTANRTAEKRSESPVAISSISKQTIEDTKANRLDQLLNKASGVFMVSLGNEQHEMSIRQPMTTKSVFLYLEDGIPVRTTGVYNHNALLEMNMAAVKNIEIMKGPASALYGAEAIAGAVNIITLASPAYTNGYISTQWNNNGYKRVDAQAGTNLGKWGMIASGYYASRSNGPVDFSDFHKTAFSVRTDYKPNDKTSWTNTLSYIDYYSDMTGALDSLKFSQRNYSTPHTFTYRSVTALRIKSMLSQEWSPNSESSVAFMYRKNSVKQNPSYSVGSTANPLVYKGQINENAFNTYAVFLQHTQKFRWLNSKLIAGASIDISPQTYYAKFIWIQKDASTGKYTGYTAPVSDSLLSNYQTGIRNMAAYVDFEISPAKSLKLVAAIRYDAFTYDFANKLSSSASSGAPSTKNNFSRITPKLGFTYNHKGIGFYANYSEGYVPPQITELFNSTKVPFLLPQSFHNYEMGGWLTLLRNKIYADWSLYQMNGTDEIISVKQTDGTSVNQNAGKTKHIGIEYGLSYKPDAEWLFRISATNAKHTFISNIVKGIDYSGKEMSAAPRFTGNTEIMYKPSRIRGFRAGIEWQHQGAYFLDDMNLYRYSGFDVINLRTGFTKGHLDIWINALNIFNTYYSTFASKSAATGTASYAYNLGDPRELTLGISYKFGKNTRPK